MDWYIATREGDKRYIKLLHREFEGKWLIYTEDEVENAMRFLSKADAILINSLLEDHFIVSNEELRGIHTPTGIKFSI